MEGRITRNYADPESRKWWEAAEKAGANPPRIVVPSLNDDLKAEAQPKPVAKKREAEAGNGEGSQ